MKAPTNKLVSFGPDYRVSILPEQNHRDLFEIGVLYRGKLVSLPGISDPDDTVTRFRTPQDVQCILKKMHVITGKLPNTG
jgi:hypothetical protein